MTVIFYSKSFKNTWYLCKKLSKITVIIYPLSLIRDGMSRLVTIPENQSPLDAISESELNHERDLWLMVERKIIGE